MDNNVISADEILAERLRSDPEFREYWERAALARAIAHQVIAYRMKHKLSQSGLAKTLGTKRSAISRLELGEHDPTLDTLRLLAGKLGMSFLVGIAPARAQSTWLAPLMTGVRERTPAAECLTFSTGGTEAFVAASGEDVGSSAHD